MRSFSGHSDIFSPSFVFLLNQSCSIDAKVGLSAKVTLRLRRKGCSSAGLQNVGESTAQNLRRPVYKHLGGPLKPKGQGPTAWSVSNSDLNNHSNVDMGLRFDIWLALKCTRFWILLAFQSSMKKWLKGVDCSRYWRLQSFAHILYWILKVYKERELYSDIAREKSVPTHDIFMPLI